MRLALLGPIAWRTPPRHYGPWERVTGLLADGLVSRGVDVTLFATLDSVTRAALDGVCPRPYEEDPDADGRVWEALHVAHALGRSGDFDLDPQPPRLASARLRGVRRRPDGHHDPRVLLTAHPARLPAVGMRVRLDLRRRPRTRAGRTSPRSTTESIPPSCPSRPVAATRSSASGASTPTRARPTRSRSRGGAGRPLVLCGPVQDERYFAAEVEPHVDDDRVRYLGSVGPHERAAVLGAAACLLHPIAFAEPFGLSVVESMICGTPVVAYPRGSMPEIVEEGVTGVLVDGVTAAAAVVERRRRAATAPPAGGPRWSASRRDRMVDDYLDVYDGCSRDRQRDAVHPPPRQPDAVARALAVPDQRRDERRCDHASATRPCCSAASRIVAASRT